MREKDRNMPENDPFLMRLQDGEKLYKIFIFRPSEVKEDNFEHRILTKEVENGLLELVSYNFKLINNKPQKYDITRATKITKEKIKEIISKMKQMTQSKDDELEKIDLSDFDTLTEQIDFLEKRKPNEYLV